MVNDIDNIKAICQEALDNTEVVTETLCENIQDYYLLGRVELANEILNELNKKPKETTQKEWVKGYKKWKEGK
jgi:hypothetical protein